MRPFCHSGYLVSPHLRIHRDDGEPGADARPDGDGRAEEGRHSPVHQRVRLDEVQALVRQRPGVVQAGAGPRRGNLKQEEERQGIKISSIMLVRLKGHFCMVEPTFSKRAENTDKDASIPPSP